MILILNLLNLFILPKKPLNLLKNTINEDVDLQIEYNETNAMFSFNSTK